jgi:hypothetical protein
VTSDQRPGSQKKSNPRPTLTKRGWGTRVHSSLSPFLKLKTYNWELTTASLRLVQLFPYLRKTGGRGYLPQNAFIYNSFVFLHYVNYFIN